MSNRLLELTYESEPDMTSVVVGVPGVLGQPDCLSLLSLPAGMDMAEQWQVYNACAGRIHVQNGSSWDHETAMFDEWLIHQNLKQGASRQAIVSLPEGIDPATIDLEAETYFLPDFSELNPSLRF